MAEAPAVGIDLGTTNTCVAIWENGKAVVIINSSNETTTPSVVSFGSSGFSVGNNSDIGDTTIYSEIVYAKSLFGADFNRAKMIANSWPFVLVNDGKNRPKYEVDFKRKKRTFYPEQISALVLRKIKYDAEKQLGRVIKKAVITIPAYFTDAQKQSTRVAAQLAGLEVIKIISEPVAASLAFGHSEKIKKERNVLVYDLGGGTFDVAIVTIDELGIYETRSTNGNTSLGGVNFDNILYEYCVKHLKGDLFDIESQSVEVMESLYKECQKAKITLSTEENTTVRIISGSDAYNVPISRKTYEELIIDEVNGTIECVKRALKDAGLDASEIDQIILVGGSTLTPLIRSALVTNFGDKLNTSLKPYEAVAVGAAIQAASLEKRDDLLPLMVRNVLPLSIGLLAKDGVVRRIIKRNTVYPNVIKCKAKTIFDNQEKMGIFIYEGEHAKPQYNRKLGSLMLKGISIAAAGATKINIEFKIDKNGQLTVNANDPKTNAFESIEIKKEFAFTNDELVQMTLELDNLNEWCSEDIMLKSGTVDGDEKITNMYEKPPSVYGNNTVVVKEVELAENEFK